MTERENTTSGSNEEVELAGI